MKRLADEIWGDCDGKTHTEHKYGKGRVHWGKPLRDVLRNMGVQPDFAVHWPTEPDFGRGGKKAVASTELDFIHRAIDGMDVYFVSNRRNQPEEQVCTFGVAGKQPEIWDPVTGTIRDVVAFYDEARLRPSGRYVDLCTAIPLAFEPFQSYFVVFRKPITLNLDAGSKAIRKFPEFAIVRNFPALATVQSFAGPWTVHFDPRWGGPASVEFPELVSWTKRPEQGIKFYSGKATYHKQFDLDAKAAAAVHDGMRLFLDLGGLKHVAEVRLNGKKLGTLWTAPWRVEITAAVRPSGNDLEIDVVNLWVNRVVGDLNLPKEKRFTETHDVFRFGMVRPTTPLLDSGLFGPVTLQAEESEPK